MKNLEDVTGSLGQIPFKTILFKLIAVSGTLMPSDKHGGFFFVVVCFFRRLNFAIASVGHLYIICITFSIIRKH